MVFYKGGGVKRRLAYDCILSLSKVVFVLAACTGLFITLGDTKSNFVKVGGASWCIEVVL
jgi:hypothetical protein